MKIGHINGYFTRYGLSDGARRMRLDGYEATDYQGLTNTEGELYSLPDEAFVQKLREDGRALCEAGLTVSQAHGPWRFPPRDATEEERAERYEKMSRALRGAAALGSPYLVIHPLMPFGVGERVREEEVYRMNVEFFTALAFEAEKCGVVIALENMPFPAFPLSTPAEICAVIDAVDSPYLRGCLDIGHATSLGIPAGDAVRTFGAERLRVLHVHDTVKPYDLHLTPTFGATKWRDFTDALREIGFSGVFSLESDFPAETGEESRRLSERLTARIARDLADAAEAK